MDPGDLFNRLADGQDRILRAVAQIETQLTAALAEQAEHKERLSELEADTHRMQGAWKLLKVGSGAIVGGVAVVGGVLKLLGKL